MTGPMKLTELVMEVNGILKSQGIDKKLVAPFLNFICGMATESSSTAGQLIVQVPTPVPTAPCRTLTAPRWRILATFFVQNGVTVAFNKDDSQPLNSGGGGGALLQDMVDGLGALTSLVLSSNAAQKEECKRQTALDNKAIMTKMEKT